MAQRTVFNGCAGGHLKSFYISSVCESIRIVLEIIRELLDCFFACAAGRMTDCR
jgi:hypothetical protein